MEISSGCIRRGTLLKEEMLILLMGNITGNKEANSIIEQLAELAVFY